VRIAQANTLYRCLDLLIEHKQALLGVSSFRRN